MDVEVTLEPVIARRNTLSHKLGAILNQVKEYQHERNTFETQRNGHQFEEYIQHACLARGVPLICKPFPADVKTVLTSLRPQLTTRTDTYAAVTDTVAIFGPGKFALIVQPYGPQNIPDFLFVFQDKQKTVIQPIEVKTGKRRPTWNNHWPKRNFIYIFACGQTHTTTYFLGQDDIADDERAIFQEYEEARKQLTRETNAKLTKFKIVDYFKFENSANYIDDEMPTRETNVMTYLTSL